MADVKATNASGRAEEKSKAGPEDDLKKRIKEQTPAGEALLAERIRGECHKMAEKLRPGQQIVHVSHGVGDYLGQFERQPDGSTKLTTVLRSPPCI